MFVLIENVAGIEFVLHRQEDNQANTSGLLGYYGSFKFVNNSTAEAELFSVGAEVFESSK